MKRIDPFTNEIYFTSWRTDLTLWLEYKLNPQFIYCNEWSGKEIYTQIWKFAFQAIAPRNEMFVYFLISVVALKIEFETPNFNYWIRAWWWNTKLWWLHITTGNYSNFWEMYCDNTFYFCDHDLFSDVF